MEMYTKLREEQLKIIDKGYFEARFYKIFAHLFDPVKQKLDHLKKQVQNDATLSRIEKTTILQRLTLEQDITKNEPGDMFHLNEQELK